MSQSSSKRLLAIGLLLVVVIAAVAIWLATRGPKGSGDKVTRLAYTAMKSDLRGLIMAEEATRRIRGKYVNDPEEAGHISSPGVTPPRIILSDTGYVASVEYKSIPGIRCTIAVFVRNPVKRFAKNGEAVCE